MLFLEYESIFLVFFKGTLVKGRVVAKQIARCNLCNLYITHNFVVISMCYTFTSSIFEK